MKNNVARFSDSAVEQVTGGVAPGPSVYPAPSSGALPCEYFYRFDLTVCPRAEADRLGVDCTDCRLSNPTQP